MLPKKKSLPENIALFFGLLGWPACAYASDPSGLIVMIYGAIFFAFLIVFPITWLVTRPLSPRWLKVLLRVAVICIFWTPVEIGGAGYRWPAPASLMEPERLPAALASIGLATLIGWLLVMGWLWARPAADHSPP